MNEISSKTKQKHKKNHHQYVPPSTRKHDEPSEQHINVGLVRTFPASGRLINHCSGVVYVCGLVLASAVLPIAFPPHLPLHYSALPHSISLLVRLCVVQYAWMLLYDFYANANCKHPAPMVVVVV